MQLRLTSHTGQMVPSATSKSKACIYGSNLYISLDMDEHALVMR
jgi:hypothetical protein